MPTPIEICAVCSLGKFGRIGHKGCSLTFTAELPEGRSIQDMAEGGVCAHPDDYFKHAEKMPPRLAAKSEPPSPVPRDQWPRWVNAVVAVSNETDKGVGDTIHRVAGLIGEAFIASLKLVGMNCGCERRRDELNIQYPYETRNYQHIGVPKAMICFWQNSHQE